MFTPLGDSRHLALAGGGDVMVQEDEELVEPEDFAGDVEAGDVEEDS